jgi:hypothetical protein
VTRLLDDHVENDQAKVAIVEQSAAAATAVTAPKPAFMPAVMPVVNVPAVALMRVVRAVMAVSAASVSVSHQPDIVSIYRKSKYIEIVSVPDFG